jgi:hypothetical protein
MIFDLRSISQLKFNMIFQPGVYISQFKPGAGELEIPRHILKFQVQKDPRKPQF